jgi:hypothetical protein
MKISSASEFRELYHNWHERTDRLRVAWEKAPVGSERRRKAYRLFIVMAKRVNTLTKKVNDIVANRIKPHFPLGGN